jgi:hypothetical protein
MLIYDSVIRNCSVRCSRYFIIRCSICGLPFRDIRNAPIEDQCAHRSCHRQETINFQLPLPAHAMEMLEGIILHPHNALHDDSSQFHCITRRFTCLHASYSSHIALIRTNALLLRHERMKHSNIKDEYAILVD